MYLLRKEASSCSHGHLLLYCIEISLIISKILSFIAGCKCMIFAVCRGLSTKAAWSVLVHCEALDCVEWLLNLTIEWVAWTALGGGWLRMLYKVLVREKCILVSEKSGNSQGIFRIPACMNMSILFVFKWTTFVFYYYCKQIIQSLQKWAKESTAP